MKTANDFRRSIGDADAAFAGMIRQTLGDLQCKEEKPVKKKISTGLVLAMVIMLLTVGAVAAGQWGILDFIKEHGEQGAEDMLVTQPKQDVNKRLLVSGYDAKLEGSSLVDITVEEAMYNDECMYVAMTVRPKQEKTLVIGADMQKIREDGMVTLNIMGSIRDISEPGSMQFAQDADIALEASVKEYAQAHGFENVVRVGVLMQVRRIDYELLEDGSLRMIVQIEDVYHTVKEGYPDQINWFEFPVDVVQYDENGLMPEDDNAHEYVEVWMEGMFKKDSRTRSSVPEDAHQIEGYRGYIESVSVTPISDAQASVIIQLDKQNQHFGVTHMAGPVVVVLGENGETLFEYELYRDIESMHYFRDMNHVQHNIVMPREGLQEDKITIRLQSWRNHNIIYDEYTYTLE